ncbi:ABC transporter ATP-binding protein [Lolliginicoccus suaedae]|uniref:ABC transporter ATP-binding protein n=1 Tax=Lolliginicoccus suaedae TaxID=2605429 RepID=UPI0011EBDB87|nr:ABC transporter ATP-binding protein [Lolliginicoccus suaedae]
MSVALRLDHLCKSFDEHVVLDDVSIDVEAGECVTVLGPSGVGKSTILRIIAGLDTATRGTILLGDQDMSAVPAEQRGVSMMFQQPLLFPHLDVLDNVAFAARAAGKGRRAARDHARDYLHVVQLGNLAHRRAGALSGGQAQRVALARALAATPRVLLLDEPFSALDPTLRTEMHDLLRQVRAELRPTIVLVTHDQQEAAVLSDRIAVLLEARFAQVAAPREIYTQPATLAVHRMMGGLNEIPGTLHSHGDGTVHRSVLGDHEITGDLPPGPGTLVFRHESVRVHSAGTTGAAITGTVMEARVMGARQRLRIDPDAGGASVWAEVDIAQPFPPGASINLSVPIEARHVIAGMARQPGRVPSAAPATQK